jgi:hypothetical protein
MSKIIEFPQLPQAVKPDARQMGERLVYSIDDLGDGALDLTVPQCLGASPQGSVETSLFKAPRQSLQDWSNQELASLYRAHRLLNLTGISFGVDRGLSDENDPWFVFLDEADQVFAHFCRIDENYYLDSAAQSDCIVASSLEALVESFARRNEMLKKSTPQQDASSQVVEFTGTARRKVLMHPGVSLAALVWSAYVLSDGLVLPLWKQSDDGGELDSHDGQAQNLDQPSLLPELSFASHFAEKGQSSVYTSDMLQTSDPREAHASNYNSVFGPGGVYALNIIGFGLTAISVSYGIYKWALPTSLLPPMQEMFQTASVAENADVLDGTLGDTAGFLQSLSGALGVINAQIRGTVKSADPVSSLTDEAQGLLDNLKTVILSLQETARTVEMTEIDVSTPLVAEATYALIDDKAVVAEPAQDTDDLRYVTLSEQNLFQKILEYDTIDFSSLSLLSDIFPSEDGSVTETVRIEEQVTTVSPLVEDVPVGKSFSLFDESAHDFIIYLMMKDQDPQRSSYNNEIVLIDMTAFDGSGGDVYARSWLFEDGSVLSTVGLKSDFEAFGLLS